MGLNSKKVLGISITTDSKKTILEYLEKYLLQTQNSKLKTQNRSVKPLIIVTPNPEQIVLAHEDTHFAEILNQADVAIPDGVGISLAAKFLKSQISNQNDQTIQKRIPGIELMEDLVKMASKEGYGVGLIGGKGGVAVKALECLWRRFPGLHGWAYDPGDVDLAHVGNLGDVCEKIRSTNTRLVFVGLGAPKQEYFIAQLRDKMLRWSDGQMVQKKVKPSSHPAIQPLVFMAVGGSFNIIAGKTPRAPQAIQAIHLEWLWRLVREPWRWRRQVTLVKFIWFVFCEK